MSAGQLKILFVLEYFWPQVGGVEQLFFDLANGLAGRGHQVSIVTSQLPGTARRQRHGEIEIWRVPAANRLQFVINAVPLALRLARNADVVHATTYAAAFPAALAGVLLRKPTVLTVHEFLGGQWHLLPDVPYGVALAYRVLEAVTVGLPFSRRVAVSRATRNALRQHGVKDRNLRTVLNGTSVAALTDTATAVGNSEEGGGSGRRSVCYFGRAGVTKGVEVLIQAFARVAAAEPATHLTLYLGNHPPKRRSRLARLAERTLGERVTVRQSVPREQLASHMSACDCVVVPSITEGFGFSVVEACSLPTVVVATDVGAIPEVVFGDHVLVPPCDARAMANGIVDALSGRHLHTEVRDFPVSAMVDGYGSVYRELGSTE